ncbi:addiction module toxin RelE [Pasteurellaceae bacterium Orientalotternb1]|nr:addiction module toxin RelE [Pasteurellaceae bacterium Orientalotternb1]
MFTKTPLKLTVAHTKDFKRDFAKLSLKQVLSPEFTEVMYLLQRNLELPAKYKDHALKGDMMGFRDCHIFSDLVLIYRIVDNNRLELIRVNTHSEIFG